LAKGGQLEIEVVSIKLGLYRISSKTQQVLLELLVLLVFPIFVNVLLIEIILLWRDERSLNLSVPEISPREVPQPRMSLNFCWPV